MSLTSFISKSLGRWAGNSEAPVLSRDQEFPDVSDAPLDSRRLIRDRRYCHVLSNHSGVEFDDLSIVCAWKGLQHEMAYVPSGSVRLLQDRASDHGRGYRLTAAAISPVPVESFYLDRDCVTNADYARFVNAGGYEKTELWPAETLAWVLRFVDRTGEAGPKFWSNGKPAEDKLDHPVVGICWYEASAYARWAGKRLPTSAEWQRAGTWSSHHSAEGTEQRYPWGNSFQSSKANLWKNDHCATIPVDALNDGNTPNGVRQLIGNVWEWLDASYRPAPDGDVKMFLEETMAEVRGGAFDTYFASQATCQFRTGQPLLNRPANVGFRCCVSTTELPLTPIKNDQAEVTE